MMYSILINLSFLNNNKCYNLTSKKCYFSTNNIKKYNKHYIPANKEWKDSIYSYDKNYLKSIPINNITTNKFVTSHFYISNLKNIARSKRMRNLITKKSSKNIFVSKPYIKHNNDKIIVNLYTYNRQKEFLIRKLYFYNRRYNFFKLWLSNSLIKNNNSFKNSYIDYNIKNRKKFFNLKIKKRFPFHGINYKNELDYLRYRISNVYKKVMYFNNIFIFLFLRKFLSLFNFNIYIPIYKHIKNNNAKNLTINLYKNKLDNIVWLNKDINKLNVLHKSDLNENFVKTNILKYKFNYKDIVLVNKLIFYFIENKFIKTNLISAYDFINMYVIFKTKYYSIFMFRFFRKIYRVLFYINGLELNNLKFSKLLYNLKVLISRIYNKKVQLNITSLKYPFLNSEILSTIIAKKAQKKIKFLKILSSSLILARKPKEILYTNRENLIIDNNILSKNELPLINNDNKDKINNIITNIYPNFLINKQSLINKYTKNNSSKLISILNTIKFKWLSGIRLQGAGRLTRRYTAERSLLKFKHKGSLKNKQYYFKDGHLKAISTVMIRNTEKSNSQYTYIGSKRRIGSFGIKSWISSY